MQQSVSFGQILREQRNILGLTQSELARRAACAPITIRKIEAGTLRPSTQLAELIAQALHIPEEEKFGFIRMARDERPPSPIPKPTPEPGDIGTSDLSGHAVKGYELAERIGSGGFGVVYRAVQPSVKRDVAIKIILPRIANHPNFIRRFEAEAHLVARLEHPYIVPLYDYWREPDAAYLVMRLLRGGNLADLLEKGSLPLSSVWQIVQQIGQALVLAHNQGVIHHDIKPANVLLDELHNAYLADFGIAKNLAFATGGNLIEDSSFITSSTYIAPEQIRDEPLRPSGDIYCFGLLIFEMLTGQQPFLGPTPLSLLQQHLHKPLPLLRDTDSEWPPTLDDILQKATAKQPQQRYSDMDALLTALKPVLQPTPIELSPSTNVETDISVLSTQEVIALENPYRGLRAFSEADAANFFGREALVQDLLGMMSDGSDLERFVAVVGPSGSGKSSVVRAGLLRALRYGGLPGSDDWFIVDLTPGNTPWQELTTTLRRVAVNPSVDLLTMLQANNQGLLRAAQHILPDDAETELLILIDQFEELFTLVEDETVRAHFLESLITAVLDPDSRLRFVITMRADFMDRPLQYIDFGELLRQRLALVTPLTSDELTRAITQPIVKLGMTMASELVGTVVQDVGDQPGMLPLLQYALTELFEKRTGQTLTLDAYNATGGVTGALARRADEIYNSLDPINQEATRQLFLRLITLGEGVEDTRRRVLLAELEALSVNGNQLSVNGDQTTDHRSPITDYGKYRLLTFDHDPVTRGPTVEVAHEALLREWPRLREWLRDSREDVRQQRLLAHTTRQWQANHQDDSYLLRGSRLTSFAAWAETTTVALTMDEHAFLQTSITTRDARHAAEAARQQRELETAQKLAGTLRQRALILTVALVVAGILMITAVFFARSSNNNATLAAAREAEALESVSLSLAANARQALDADNQPLALLLALAANSTANPPLVAWHTLVDIAYAPGVNRQFVHDSPINDVAVSPDGTRILTGSDDGLVLLWDAVSGEILQQLDGHVAPVRAVAFSPDGQWALSGGEDDTAVLWNLDSGEIVQRLVSHKGDVSGVAFTPDGQYAVTSEDTAAAPSDLIVWDLESGEILHRFGSGEGGNLEGILDMALSGDGRTALVGQLSYADNNNRQTMLWDVQTGEPVHVLSAVERTVAGVAMSPNGRFGLAGSGDTFIYQWDLESGELVQRLEGHEGSVLAVAYSPNGKEALSASLDQTLIWWDLTTGEIIRRFASGAGEIHSLHFLNDTQAVTGSTDGTVQIWDMTSAWQLAYWGADGSGHLPPAPGTENRGMALTISPDGQVALSGGNDPDSDLILWDYETGAVLGHLTGSEGSIFDASFTPDGEQVLAASQDGTLILWDISTMLNTGVSTGRAVQRLEGHQGMVNGVDVSSNGRYAVSSSLDGAVIYWDLTTGEILQRMWGHFDGRGAYDVAFLPGEQQAISSSWDGTMIVWDLQRGEQVQRFTGLAGDAGTHFSADGYGGIHKISVSPDGKSVLSAGRDDSLLLWDVVSGKSLRRFIGHTGYVVDVAFAPNGQTALSTARNDALIVWDISTGLNTGVATGTPIRRLPINNRLNSSFRPTLAIHPDGKTALSTEADGTILKWQLAEPEPADLLTWLRANRYVRELTCAERDTYGIEPLCVDGISEATTADLLAAVTEATQSLELTETPIPVTTADPLPTRPVAAHLMETTAVLGDNRGELRQHQFDVWMYEGQAGEVLQFQMIADNPVTDVTIPMAERYDAGVLDTLLFLIAPDGTLLTKASDDPADDGTFRSDANIEAIVLPQDGKYRIEARNFLDEGAGGYTLRIMPRTYTVDPAILQEYEGHYLEGPWEYDWHFYLENGRLFIDVEQTAETYDLIPLSDNEFLMSDGSRVVFTRDTDGTVTGFKEWISLIHPIGGQWYEGGKLED